MVWEFAVQPRPSPGGSDLLSALGPSLENLPALTRHLVGAFGGLETPLPMPAFVLWAVIGTALLVGAAVLGGRRERVALGGLVVGAVVVVVGMSLVYREIGPLQGRYALPALFVVPLWAGEVVRRHHSRLPAATWRKLTLGVAAVAAVAHGWGFLATARRYAEGDRGSLFFVGSPEWAPPAGWAPWLVVVAAGCACLVAGAQFSRARE